jgi:hypothetical protein
MIFMIPLAMTIAPDKAVNAQMKHTIGNPGSIAVVLSLYKSGERVGKEE